MRLVTVVVVGGVLAGWGVLYIALRYVDDPTGF